jgi:uncharacterized protein YbjT (DUF2867 family)
MSNPKNILIVGGTGRLGGFIIDAVLAKNADVHIRVLGRKKDDQLIQNSYADSLQSLIMFYF